MVRFISSQTYSLIIGFFLVLLISQASASDVNPSVKSLEKTEDWDRQVDQAALQSQEAAVQKLKKLTKKYANSREEAGLLMRLADVYQESAAIEFRIAYAKANRKKLSVALNRYHSLLKSQIEVLNRMIQVFPNFYSIDLGLFMRGKANEELKNKAGAKADFLTLVKNFPQSSRAIPSYMSLAEMAIADNRYPEAISYLKEVEHYPENSFYPFALYKLAWAFSNLKDPDKMLSYIERHVRYYDQLKIANKGLSSGDVAIRENSLLDAVSFFLEGNEQRPEAYKFTSALSYFRKLEPGPFLGKMSVRFAKSSQISPKRPGISCMES
jgi:tetratricopeptide (TPR) repeat protein